MEIDHDRVGDGRCNFPHNVFTRIGAVSDDHDFHRTPDVSQIKNCLGQIHFFPCGNEDGCVKDFPAGFMNGSVSITDLCNDATGAGKTPFHLLTTL